MNCPKCNLTQPDQNIECPRCGVIFAKLGIAPVAPPQGSAIEQVPEQHLPRSNEGPARSVPPPLPRRDLGPTVHDFIDETEVDEEEIDHPGPRCLDRTDLLMVLAGAVLAALALVIPFVRNTFAAMLVLIHEMGHFIFGWIFGYPSFPAFDFVYGGGITLHIARSPLLLGVEYVLLGVGIYLFRSNVRAVVFLILIGSVHAACAFTSAHHVVILFMGHGTELAIAAIFLYRALSGAAVVYAGERPLYAAVAFFIVFYDLAFAYGLVTQPAQRTLYEAAKGGGHWMDFSRIAEEHLHTKLSSVAMFFLLCSLLPIPVGYLMFRYQEYLRAAVTRLAAR